MHVPRCKIREVVSPLPGNTSRLGVSDRNSSSVLVRLSNRERGHECETLFLSLWKLPCLGRNLPQIYTAAKTFFVSSLNSRVPRRSTTDTKMEAFQKKTLKVSRGYTYTYYTLPGDSNLPPLFFHHGWPDHAQMWEGIALRLQSSGVKHAMIIPDLLGYDGTSKPTDPEEYRWDKMMTDLVEIIDKEGHQKVISVGHDWGSASAARLVNYHPDRTAGLVLFNVAYLPPSRAEYDLDKVNQMTEQIFGYPQFAYWHLFTAENGPEILRNNVGRLYDILHNSLPDGMRKFFCVNDAIKNYLENGGEELPLRSYAQDPKFKQAFVDRMTRDGFEGPQCWYKATRFNVQTAIDKQLPEENDTIKVPVFYVGCHEDPVCRPEAMIPAKQAGMLPDIEESPMVDAAHWVAYENPDVAAKYMGDWLKKRYSL